MRLGVSILIDINEEWMTTKRYLLSMDADWDVGSQGVRNYRKFGTLPLIQKSAL